MKVIFPLLLFFTCLSSCNKDKKTQKEIEAVIKKGTWKIETLICDSIDITGNYEEYYLTFKENGIAIATNDTTIYTGAWSTSIYSILNNPKDDRHRLNMKFSVDSNNKLKRLNQSWHVKNHLENQLQLFDGDDDGRYVLILKEN